MSPGSASRMPATPRITVDPSPTISPPSSAASSASVRVMTRPSPPVGSARSAGCGTGVQLRDHLAGEVELAVGIDDESTRGVEHHVQSLVARDLLHHGADLRDDFARRALVLRRGATLRSP